VYKGVDLLTNEVRAIKRIKKKKLSPSAIELQRREIKIMSVLNHENIVRLYGHVETSNHLYLVMEFCSGMDLTHHKDIGEEQALNYMRQLVAGLTMLREKRIAHRDLKPENILLSDNSPDATLKIADFGVARTLDDGSLAKTYVGTPYYMAPEVSKIYQQAQGISRYNESADLWSLGVIVYELLAGRKLFQGATDQSHLSLMQCNAQEINNCINALPASPALKDLLSNILRYNPSDRIHFQDLQHHPLIEGNGLTRPIVNLTGVECLKPRSRECSSLEEAIIHANILITQAIKTKNPFPFYTLTCAILRKFVKQDLPAKNLFHECLMKAESSKSRFDASDTSLSRLLSERAVELCKKAVCISSEKREKAWDLFDTALILLKYVEEGPAVVNFRKIVQEHMSQIYS